jgi:NADH-quinone oxidoreductase subunit L
VAAAGGLHVDMGFLADPLSSTFILFVTGVGTLIHIFSVGYMHGDERFSRFFAYMNLFVASMLILVLGSSFLVTFLGWEGVGLCSYLLVGFWFERRAAATASKKAFITTRVGDVGFMIAMFLIFLELGSLDYGPTLANAGTVGSETATAIALLLFLGAIGKSAQFPLHVWLPDAMEGPTPVSALIHAATMVTAGVFLVARAHPFFEAGSDALTVVAWIGAVTALLAATVAVMQNDVKRVLAYSTISQLGYMFLALGIGAYSAAIFHVVTHAFFKAALFLGAGSVIHGNADNQDMRIMGGFRKYMPITAGVCVAAWLAISGVPPFSGFWSKDEILSKAFFADEYGLWIFGVVAALLTGFYMTRLIWMVFYGNERWRSNGTAPVVAGGADDEEPTAEEAAAEGASPDAASEAMEAGNWDEREPTVQFGEPPRTPQLGDHEPHESPPVMTAPLVVLGVLAMLGGIILIPLKGLQFLDDWLEPVFHGVAEIHTPSFAEGVVLTAISVIAGFVGIGIGVWPSTAAGSRRPPTTRSSSASDRSAACSATPTTSTRASPGSSTSPGVASRRWSTSSTTSSSTAPCSDSPGSSRARRVACAGAERPRAQLRAVDRGRRRRAARVRDRVGGAVGDERLPDPHRTDHHALHRRARRAPRAVATPRAGPHRRVPLRRRHAGAVVVAARQLRDRSRRLPVHRDAAMDRRPRDQLLARRRRHQPVHHRAQRAAVRGRG